MHNALYLPPTYIPETAQDAPVIFLAGPIQGTTDWQSEATKLIHTSRPDIVVASPRRAYLPGEFDYVKQVNWETFHLRRAAKYGAILFWLARETEHVPGRAYAQTSRFELAEWKVRHERDTIKLVIGIEEGFSGATYIRHRFSQDCPKVPLLNTLSETCIRAIAEIFP